jgi:hypothetical protein
MDSTPNSAKKAAPFPFLLLLISFLLPFLEFSCQGNKIAALSGYQTGFGTELDSRDTWSGQVKKEKVDATPMVAVVLLLGVVAGLVAFAAPGAAAILGTAAVILLFVAQSQIEKDVLAHGKGMIAVSFQSGFYGSILLLLAGAGLSAYAALSGRTPPPLPTDTGPVPSL